MIPVARSELKYVDEGLLLSGSLFKCLVDKKVKFDFLPIHNRR